MRPSNIILLGFLVLASSLSCAAGDSADDSSAPDAGQIGSCLLDIAAKFVSFVGSIKELLKALLSPIARGGRLCWIVAIFLGAIGILHYRNKLRQWLNGFIDGLGALVWNEWFLRTFLANLVIIVLLIVSRYCSLWPDGQLAAQAGNNRTASFHFVPEQPQQRDWRCPDDCEHACGSGNIVVSFQDQYAGFQDDSSETLRSSVWLSTLPNKHHFIKHGVDSLHLPWEELYKDVLQLDSKKLGDHERMGELMSDTAYNLRMLEWSKWLPPGPDGTALMPFELQHCTRAAHLCHFATKAVDIYTPDMYSRQVRKNMHRTSSDVWTSFNNTVAVAQDLWEGDAFNVRCIFSTAPSLRCKKWQVLSRYDKDAVKEIHTRCRLEHEYSKQRRAYIEHYVQSEAEVLDQMTYLRNAVCHLHKEHGIRDRPVKLTVGGNSDFTGPLRVLHNAESIIRHMGWLARYPDHQGIRHYEAGDRVSAKGEGKGREQRSVQGNV